MVGRDKKKSFSIIKERIWKKLKGWKEKLLSQAGREILIKAIIQAISTYTMSCFKLLKCLIKDIETLIRKFWWGYRGEQRKIHSISWEKLCLPKNEGGMGFRELSKFKDSLLTKQFWRLNSQENFLFHKVFKAKFFRDCSIMDCDNSNKGSYAWKSLCQARHVIELGSVWRVGDGQSIQIRRDRWLPKTSCSRIVSPLSVLPLESRVCDLINSETHTWKVDLVKQVFIPQEASIILGIPLSLQGAADKQVWLPTPQGTFSTRSAYKLLAGVSSQVLPSCSSLDRNHLMWNSIWNLQVPHKVKHMIWRATHNALPSLYNLWRRKVVRSVLCSSCKSDSEDIVHVLWSCGSLIPIWESNEVTTKLLKYKFFLFADLWEMLLKMKERLDVNLMAMIFWFIWSRRNSVRVGE